MDRINVAVKGKIEAIKEDTITGSFGRMELRIVLIIGNELLGMHQMVAFVRPGQTGDILGTLINDFKEGKKLNIEGKISYFLGNLFFGQKLPLEFTNAVKRLKVLSDATDWTKISGDDKKALDEFLGRATAPFSGKLHLNVSVDGRVKYTISSDETLISVYDGADIYLT